MKKNYIILAIVLVLIVGGVYYKKYKITTPPNSPLPESPKGEVDNSSTPAKATPEEANNTTLTYDEYLQQGINLETKGKLAEALKAYQNASEVSPKAYVPYSNAGSVFYHLGNYPEAEKHFLEALDLEPNNISVYTKLYELYFYGMKKNPEQMTVFFHDAMKDTKNDINIVGLYAFYLEQISDFESALSIWQSLLNLEPDNASYKAKVEALQNKINS